MSGGGHDELQRDCHGPRPHRPPPAPPALTRTAPPPGRAAPRTRRTPCRCTETRPTRPHSTRPHPSRTRRATRPTGPPTTRPADDPADRPADDPAVGPADPGGDLRSELWSYADAYSSWEADPDTGPDPDAGPDAPAWSTWDVAEKGPEPRPDWLVTALAAVDTDLGVLKTGKEADVHLLNRGVPGTAGCDLAAKRYRPPEHKLFARDAGYLEGRRVRRSREMRAMAHRTGFGRELLAGQWAAAEFAALSALWSAGAAVPYPVQLLGTEVLLEFIGADGVAAPRLAALRPAAAELVDLFDQLRTVLAVVAGRGWAHGDLSAYNLLVHRGRLVLIDLPQVVDVVANPNGQALLHRDCENVCRWFAAHGLRGAGTDTETLFGELVAVAIAS